LGLSEVVIRAGEIPHAQVLALYGAADLFVFPSFTESFGYPMVEAMFAGIPAVAAGTAVNREILQDASEYFTERSVEQCEQAIHRMLSDADLFAARTMHAKERALLFTWPGYARHFLSLLDAMVRGRRPAASARPPASAA
jgi:glycosyltransferase involved in cell wall biosynthesis